MTVLDGPPQVFFNRGGKQHWLVISLRGTRSNRTVSGARPGERTDPIRYLGRKLSFIQRQATALRAGSDRDRESRNRLAFGTRQVLNDVRADQFLKSVNRRNLDPNPVDVLAGVADVSPEVLQHLQAGAEAEKQRHFDVAIAEFKKATELAPTRAEAFASLGQAYMENQDYGAAIAPLKHALTLSPDLAAAHQLLGYALLARAITQSRSPIWRRPRSGRHWNRADRDRTIAASGGKSPGRAGAAP